MSRVVSVPGSSPRFASALRADSSFLSPRFAVALLTAATLLVFTIGRAHADWMPGGTHFGARGDATVFGADGRGGMFSWAGYPASDAEYFIGADGDTLPGWSAGGLPLVPGNRPWADHESFEPLAGLPDANGGSYILVAEQWPSIWGVGFLSGQQLYVHRRTASGEAASGWNIQGVRLETPYLGHRFEWHHQATMVADGRNGVFVAWMDEQQPYSRVLLQKVSANGAALWDTDGVYAQRAADACTLPTLVADGRGGVLVFISMFLSMVLCEAAGHDMLDISRAAAVRLM